MKGFCSWTLRMLSPTRWLGTWVNDDQFRIQRSMKIAFLRRTTNGTCM